MNYFMKAAVVGTNDVPSFPLTLIQKGESVDIKAQPVLQVPYAALHAPNAGVTAITATGTIPK